MKPAPSVVAQGRSAAFESHEASGMSVEIFDPGAARIAPAAQEDRAIAFMQVKVHPVVRVGEARLLCCAPVIARTRRYDDTVTARSMQDLDLRLVLVSAQNEMARATNATLNTVPVVLGEPLERVVYHRDPNIGVLRLSKGGLDLRLTNDKAPCLIDLSALVPPTAHPCRIQSNDRDARALHKRMAD